MTLTRRGLVVVVLTLVMLLFLVPTVSAYASPRSIGVFGGSDPGKRVPLVIDEGATARTIGEVLEEHDVIDSALGFRIAAYLEGGAEDIQAGRYEVPTGLSAPDALSFLVEEGPVVEFVTVTFPEGSWLTDFATVVGRETHISETAFLDVVENAKVRSELLPADVDTLEGLLFPSTYQVVDTDTARTLAQRLVDEFEEQAQEVDFERKAQTLGITPYEAVIVASMIEGEAAVPEDRDKIARVIYNRLERGIALGIDATVLYALGEHKEELTKSDLAIESPYNTRLVEGLPPTPIGAPGSASLEAAVNPARGEWLYYVLADCEGHHAFSESYDDFLHNKAAYQALEC